MALDHKLKWLVLYSVSRLLTLKHRLRSAVTTFKYRLPQIRQRMLDELQFLQFSRKVIKSECNSAKNRVVMIDGNDHEIIWSIRWSVMLLPLMRNGYKPIVLTRVTSTIQNKYYGLFGCRDFIFIDEFYENKVLPDYLLKEVESILESKDIKQSLLDYHYKEIPVGKITLSGHSRYQLKGAIDFNISGEVEKIRNLLIRNLTYAFFVDEIVGRLPDLFITSEAFHDDHGIFYYHMLNNNVNIIKTNLSVMDDRVLVQRRNKHNDGMHHNTIARKTFDTIRRDLEQDFVNVRGFVEKNLSDRYSDKWHLSKRNFKDTLMATKKDIIKAFELDPSRKIATIFSHVLYDTLYFFEDELFKDYSDWLVKTVEWAIENPNVNWLLKLHPSNAWRGEYQTELEYEEKRLLDKHFGTLPKHVKLVLPGTKINPLSWIQHSDLGITVRGTIGMEMPCFGNTVITAATGRYSNLGFTLDPKTSEEYRDLLLNLHHAPQMTEEQIRLAQIYYYIIFSLKPLRLSLLKPVVRSGFKEVRLFGSLYSVLVRPVCLNDEQYPCELEDFAKWAESRDKIDYINGWEEYA